MSRHKFSKISYVILLIFSITAFSDSFVLANKPKESNHKKIEGLEDQEAEDDDSEEGIDRFNALVDK